MSNHPSAEKRNRQRQKKTDRNRAVKSSLRTKIKKAHSAIEGASADVKVALVDAVTAIDKAATKGVLHARSASRKKSRLARAAHKAATAAKLETEKHHDARRARSPDRRDARSAFCTRDVRG